MDPSRNPYAPGAGQRPPELAGRDDELDQFRVILDRAVNARPTRSVMLAGLRGVGKTVLLNEFRLEALHRGWGAGKIEGRADVPLRRPLAQALHRAAREVGAEDARPRLSRLLGVLKAFSLKAAPDGSWSVAVDVDAASGTADSGDLEIDLTELFVAAGEAAADLGSGIALFVDEAQDVGVEDLAALCGACHEVSQRGLPLLVVGAGLPHLPMVLTSAKTYAERLFSYVRVDRLDRDAADRALVAPARREGVEYTSDALDRLAEVSDGYPYFVQAYGQAVWDAARSTPITEVDVLAAMPDAYAELEVGFFGSRWDRATPKERDYMRAMAALGEGPVPSADVAGAMGRRRRSDVSVFRDGLLKKGMIYSGERGTVAFTVPHFARFVRSQPQ